MVSLLFWDKKKTSYVQMCNLAVSSVRHLFLFIFVAHGFYSLCQANGIQMKVAVENDRATGDSSRQSSSKTTNKDILSCKAKSWMYFRLKNFPRNVDNNALKTFNKNITHELNCWCLVITINTFIDWPVRYRFFRGVWGLTVALSSGLKRAMPWSAP